MAKRFVWILFGLAVISVLAYSFQARPVFVEMVQVGRASLQVNVVEEGKTRLIDRFIVSAPVSGFAHRINLDVGDVVIRGEVLLKLAPQRSRVLDPRSRAGAEARVAAGSASLRAAKEGVRASEADATLAMVTLKRIKKLQAEGLSPQEVLDEAEAKARRARSSLKSSKFAVEVARFKLEEAKTTLRYSGAEDNPGKTALVSIKAPVHGRILKIMHQSEGVVQEGQNLIEIGDPSALEVETEVLSADAIRINPGMKVFFERWGGNAPLEGRVRIVEPAGFTKTSALGVEEQRVRVLSEIRSPKPLWERLGDGFRVESRFVLWQGEDILQVPTNSLFRYKDGFAVFIVQADKAIRQKVEIGHQNGLSTEILTGLSEGEWVITHPNDAIEDGASIRTE